MDGRRAKGERRRREIIDATLRVIERDGVAGVTHRVVAREAGVPTTATTYYFSSLDDLLVAALTTAAEDYVSQVLGLAGEALSTRDSAAALADLLAESAGPRRGRTIAEYELHLLAARRPALRPAARRWIEVMRELCRELFDDEAAFRALIAAVDGLMVEALVADEPPGVEDFRPVLEYLIGPRTRLPGPNPSGSPTVE
ncbi:TetR family transcriptional regulator [Longimycelium tulufanense]|uniref:TetR family transcriptional regulator n=1 Tax=Longimycelium tulufanense TaxID=907463 RepID=A0A8J3FTN4_9PSEU|nr:TetR family transcriptional regulator [Longimycelium tulufanense]GGM47513.1 TetR family transcriptional regulator [Longimycelium tulufanense]